MSQRTADSVRGNLLTLRQRLLERERTLTMRSEVEALHTKRIIVAIKNDLHIIEQSVDTAVADLRKDKP